MKKTMIMSLILSGILAFSSNAADFGGRLYVADDSIRPGETSVLSIQLENDIEISGFQIQMILPDGIAYQSWAINEDRLPAGATPSDLVSMQRFDAPKFILATALNFGAGAAFTQNSGEIATVTIYASPDMLRGEYEVEVSAIDVCDPQSNDYDVPATTFLLTVGETTGIETLHPENGDTQIYDLQGRHQSQVSAGQAAIMNGRAVYLK